jgi:hypothetical protein
MYQPRQPLIELSPRLTARRLSEVELGQLLLLADDAAGAGIGVRGDVLSARGDVIEGLFRLHGELVRFERRELGERVVAIELAYVLESELGSAGHRSPAPGDLLLSGASGTAGVLVAGPWPHGEGLLDLGSAVARPYEPGAQTPALVVPDWRLIEREPRGRVLFRRVAGEPVPGQRWREPSGEDCD